MKKGSAALVAALILTAIVATTRAQSSSVYSVNVVGFQRVEARADELIMKSLPFVRSSNTLNDVIGTNLTGGSNLENADNVFLWDTDLQAYRKFFLAGDVGSPEFDHQWIDAAAFEVATNRFEVGRGFWIVSHSDGDQVFTVGGDVVTNDVMSKLLVPGLQMLSYPFNAPVALSNLTFQADGARTGTNLENADNVFLWDAEAQTYRKFFLAGDVGMPEFDYQWINAADFAAATNRMYPGQSFWYIHRGGGFAWDEVRPYDFK